MKKYLTVFQNIKFNVWLFSALAVASILGTLIPQIPENPDKVREFLAHSPKIGAIFEKAQLFNIYFSWWFVGLLGLLAFDVIVCKLIFAKFPGLHTFRKKDRDPSLLSGLEWKEEWRTRLKMGQAAQKIEERLEKRKYKVGIFPVGGGDKMAVLAARHRLQRFGSWVSHIAILLILLSNLTGALYGFKEILNIVEGTHQKMQNRPWTVACDQFIVEWYPDSSTPRTFASDLRLYDGGVLAETRRIVVNEPLEYKKVRFYQASYGPYLKEARVGFFMRKDPKRSPAVTLHLDEEVPVPGTPYSLRILQFIPDFSMGEDMRPESRSVHPHNPALQVQISRDGKPLRAPWIFQNFPGMQMPPVEEGDDFVPVLAEYVPSFYTGLQIAYDPGADLFWISCAVLVLGLMVLFYMHHRKVWIFLEPDADGKGAKITAGGYSSRGRAFQAEFARLVHELKSETA